MWTVGTAQADPDVHPLAATIGAGPVIVEGRDDDSEPHTEQLLGTGDVAVVLAPLKKLKSTIAAQNPNFQERLGLTLVKNLSYMCFKKSMHVHYSATRWRKPPWL